ncbi:hypothetical protein AB833_16525 [Chromatiales bacterium (ex Bugula neritina AB1)]|nr:hypothetical protein AB833_16525 [Chromatiales bacterium (ex Bugula neritina AB1)]
MRRRKLRSFCLPTAEVDNNMIASNYKIAPFKCSGVRAGLNTRAVARGSMSLALVFMLLGCVSTDESEKITVLDDTNNGLKVSLSDYRFGIQEVGSRTQQGFVLTNVGVDSYPINSVSIGGEQSGDYRATAEEGRTLNPGEKLNVNVSFEPTGEGRRLATLDINYDVIRGVGSNAVEFLYYNARTLENSGDIVAASQEYRRYLDGGNTTVNKPRAMIKLSLLDEADIYGIGKDFNLYKEALNQRETGDIGGALQSLNLLLTEYGDSYLVDDAKYMLGYIQLVDQGEYEKSYNSMQSLIDDHANSSYVDTALYSQGLAEYEMGNIERAEEIFVALRDRHTGVKLELFEMKWPKDNYVSRLWFDKAEEQIETLEKQSAES